MHEETDTKLATSISKGDTRAEEILFRKYRLRILKMVRYTLGKNRTDCEDLVNDICLAVLMNLRNDKFEGNSSLGTYIYGIAKNKIAAYLRGEKPENAEIPEEYPDVTPIREEEMEKEETFEILKLAMEKLKPKYKKVLYLHYFEDLSIFETAQKLNISPRKVSERKNYAFKKLKKFFNKSSVFSTKE